MTRKRIILGVSLAVALLLIVSGVTLWRESQKNRARVDERFPLPGLDYCSPNSARPCILSFSQTASGDMLVSFLTDGAFYPDFYLKIRAGEDEHIYVCEKVTTFSTSVYCTGKVLPVGETLQFFLVSIHEDIVLAQGTFPILGMALAGPGVYESPTPTTLALPTDEQVPETTPSPSYPGYPSSNP